VFSAIHEAPFGYLTVGRGALGDSRIIPVFIINRPVSVTETGNLSRFLGAGPAYYSPTPLYLDP